MSITKPKSLDKPTLRDYYLEKRKILLENKDKKSNLDTEIQSRLLMSREYRAADTVLVYAARGNEIATSMIIRAALVNNKTVALPVCSDDGTMIFCRIRSPRELTVGRYGILEPPAGEPVTADESTLCVCPCLCCDMRGHRLGYGAGYYDRYLATFPGVKAALCYSDSLIPAFDTQAHDITMDVIFSDNFTRYCKA